MVYDVVVVGAGIGGLTVGALLAARGINVCVFERGSQVGGCVQRVEYSGFDFEPGMGVYTGWGSGEIFERVFSDLPVEIPQSRALESDYVVRLPDGTDIRLRRDWMSFAEELRNAFPESANEAVAFYELIDAPSPAAGGTIANYLAGTSLRFRRFIDCQLRAFIQTPIERCAFSAASNALSKLRQKHYSIVGGPATLTVSLEEAIKRCGGRVRLNSPVLRLAYDESGSATGVDLLSGERVVAKRAIVSNMTIWDTYGKLIGLNRTPPEVKKLLTKLIGSGAYLIYATIEESGLQRLPVERFLMCFDLSDATSESSEITFATSKQSTIGGKRPVTLKSNCSVNDWFTFQSSMDELEDWDQQALETVWQQLHQSAPELGGDIEVIETANPRSFYEDTRRKLGMVLGVEQTPDAVGASSFRTTLPNVYLVGDTVAAGSDLAAVTEVGLSLAQTICQEM